MRIRLYSLLSITFHFTEAFRQGPRALWCIWLTPPNEFPPQKQIPVICHTTLNFIADFRNLKFVKISSQTIVLGIVIGGTTDLKGRVTSEKCGFGDSQLLIQSRGDSTPLGHTLQYSDHRI
ncbi:unnamed protein product [Kuraishia capsulata CBS 1993]|uniref:Uncharacterized protein n=1 Tax=Kuraishia capsulata CBS 1993 TaxID=1382522 RepID=W6MJL4_9ASCO|nr:uncharacterized protein KUCA_T00002443001 [Kuraishia capsulata CBS 1993]CDK26471.1 unnamed protein product [Kuraishia capsulata CBS 1993]